MFKRLGKWSHVIYAGILPLYLVLYFAVEKLVVTDYWVTDLPIDNFIPFCEYFVIPYVLWLPFLVIPGLVLMMRNGPEFKRYMSFIGLSFISTLAFCLIVPNGQNLRPTEFPRDNFFTSLVQWLYAADTNTNVLPSMHVIGCFAPLFAAHRTLPKRLRWLEGLALVETLLVCAATVLIKQHAILDVFVAIPWALFWGWVVYQKLPFAE